MTNPEELKMYSDYKSPFAWLAFDPAFALEEKFAVKVKWKPFQLRIKGSGQRSVYSEYKVKYSYMDARRIANERSDKKIIRGPLISATAMKIFRGERVGTIYGAISIGTGLGSAFGSWGGGLIHDLSRSYNPLIAFSLVSVILGMIPFLVVPALRR